VKRLRLTPEAELDLDEAHLWYHTQTPDRAADFLAAVDACLATIQRHPQSFTLVDSTMRRALVRRFPYAIFYELETAPDRGLRHLPWSQGSSYMETAKGRITSQ
jgi:plasmid stabilization system protein ParE